MFPSTKKILIVLVVLNLLAGLLYAGAFMLIKRKGERTSSLQNDITLEAKKERRLKLIKDMMLSIAAERSELESHFIGADKVVDFLDSLNSLARQSDVKIAINAVNFAPVLPDQPSDYFETLKLELQAEGSWAGVYRFLSLLETLPFKTTFDRLDLDRAVPKDEKSKSKLLWQGTFGVRLLKMKSNL